MKNRTEKNVLRSSCGIFAAALLLVISTGSTTLAANNNVPGTDCAAYNNNQANALERSHVRLLNPATNNQSLWVICSPTYDTAQATTGAQGYAIGFFDTGVTANIDCVFREFSFWTKHVPGGEADAGNTINAVAFTITPPAVTPGTNGLNVNVSNVGSPFTNILTYACKLPPGTGINMVGWYPY